jgi:hypothetical protein
VILDEYVGAYRNLHVEAACGKIVLRAGAALRHAPGDAVRLAFDVRHLRLFDPGSGRAL